MRLFSPAKLNLFFRILAKRSDGYHEIASLMQAIDLGDWLTIKIGKQDRITCTDSSLSCDKTNLIHKALILFRSRIETPPMEIHLEKQIPMQAGLGGGSSNAATTLWGLNYLMGNPFSIEQLSSLGACLGSDVPFFFSLGTAFCTGKGELCEPVSIPPFYGLIKKPFYGLCTPEVYRNVCLEKLSPTEPKELLSAFLQNKPCYVNDLELPAFSLEPRLQIFKKELLSEFETVFMTGSGTAFFCIQNNAFSYRSITRDAHTWYQKS